MIYWDDVVASVGNFIWATCLVVFGIAVLAVMVLVAGFVFHLGWDLVV